VTLFITTTNDQPLAALA